MIGPRGCSYRGRADPRQAPRPRTARRAARVGGQGARGRDLPLEPRGDLGGRAVRLAGLRAEPASERRPLGRPHPDPRPRLGDRRLGAVGQRLVPPYRRTRLRRGATAWPPRSTRSTRSPLAGVGRVFGGHYVVAGIVVSLAAALAAFVLLYRLTETRLGADGARRAVLYLAVFPMALFLGAVYSESLFLALAIGAFLLAERGRWLGAGLVTGLAMLTRIAGIALLPGARGDGLAAAGTARCAPPPVRRAARLRRLSLLPRGLPRRRAAPSPGRRASGTATSRMRVRSAGSGTGCARPGQASSSSPRARTRTSTGRLFRTPTRCAPRRSTWRRSRSSCC